MKIILLMLAGVLLSFEAIGQERLSSPVGFSVEKPPKWTAIERVKLDKSIEALAFSPEKIERILQTGRNSVLVFAFSKYSPSEVSGPIPTIQVRMRSNPISDFEEFRSAFIRSVTPGRTPFEAYQIIGEPVDIEISGMRAVLVNSKYLLRDKNGGTTDARARTYAIPNIGYYFQVTMIDFPKREDAALDFDVALKSIQITKVGS